MGGEVLVAVYFPEFSAVAVLDGGAAVLEGVDDSFVAADAAGNGLFAPEGGVLAGSSGEAVAGDAEVVVGFATGGVGDFCGAAARELGVLIEPGFELLGLLAGGPIHEQCGASVEMQQNMYMHGGLTWHLAEGSTRVDGRLMEG